MYNMPLALNCYKVRQLLSLLKVPHAKHPVGLLTGDHQTPDYLALNPFGQVPILTDGALVLRDSQAILIWLSRKLGGDQWMPTNPDDEALINACLSAAAFERRLGPYEARLAKHSLGLCINADRGGAKRASAGTF